MSDLVEIETNENGRYVCVKRNTISGMTLKDNAIIAIISGVSVVVYRFPDDHQDYVIQIQKCKEYVDKYMPKMVTEQSLSTRQDGHRTRSVYKQQNWWHLK
jgi:hypothetical protein